MKILTLLHLHFIINIFCLIFLRLQILEARDKLYRLVNAKITDINKATKTKGTCKDMCPEKERLMREARYQIASFELNDNDSSMNQRKAIKQYSRSAADAEAPLPHELRPETSLKTTMTYLLHNIIDLCEDENTSIGDWYHFVWDRTRGIRKDITQQELSSPITVELVEQCVRFHIHCSARLIAEDPSIFDQKINTENLTKCLQSLKYMYNDLKVKNVKCPNEAEFRAYVVLLNLNESGNFLWEIKQLEKSILNSKEVRFALDVYFSIANHNYVKFFNLARNASYMNACLMLRYFTQVRMKAINIIMRSYTPRKQRFNYNISYLTEILAFEDFESTLNFLTHHGLECDVDADIVYLDRSMFGTSDTPYQMERALSLVESKMESTVAQAVCHGELPSADSFLKLVPHSSFDNDGFLKRDSIYAEDQNGPNPTANDNVFKVPRDSPPVSPMFQQRVQKSDQPDGSASENVFNKSNPFSTPKPTTRTNKNVFKAVALSETKAVNPFSQKMSFGSPQSQTSAQSIFGIPAVNKPSAFNATKPLNQKPEAAPASSFSFAKALTQEPSKPTNSMFGGPITTFGTPAVKEIFSFSKPIEQPRPIFGFHGSSSQQVNNQELKRKEQEALAEKLRLEEEIKAMEKLEAERRRQKLIELKMEQDRLEAERLHLEEEKKRLEEIAKRERMEKSCEAILNSLIDEAVEEKARKEAEQSIHLYVEIPEEFYDALEFDFVVDEIYRIYRQEFFTYVNQTKMKYETMHKCFSLWRQTTADEIRRREKLSTIGCSIMNTSLEEQADGLHHPQQRASLSNMKQYLKGSPQAITLPENDNFKPINLFEDLKMKPIESTANIFWKLVVSIPHKNEERCLGFSAFINRWLSRTFGESKLDDGTFYLEEKIAPNSRKKLGICIRKVQGAEILDEKGKRSSDVVRHSNGIVFFTSIIDLKASRARLQKILDKVELPVSVSLIVYLNQVEANAEGELRQHMDLSLEVNVSDFEINLHYECHEKQQDLRETVLYSFQFLNNYYVNQLEKNFKLFDFEMQYILDFFQITIGDEMWRRVEMSCKQSEKFAKRMNCFNAVIELYNKCLDKLMEMVTNDFSKMPSLPDEFRKRLLPINFKIPNSYEYFPENWKSKEIQKKQIKFIHELKMVKMQNDDFKNFDDFRNKLMTFLNTNISLHKDKVFQAVVAKVIDSLYQQNLVNNDDIAEAISNYSWLNIISEIVVGKFNEVYQKNPQVPSRIIYHKEELQKYKSVPWWFSFEFSTADHEEPQRKKAKITPPTSAEIEELLKKSANSLDRAKSKIENFKEISSKTRETSKDFDQHLYKVEENFRKKLSAWEEKFK